MEVVAVLYRVRQFFRGIFASRLSKDEVDFVKENLPEAAWELFFQMNRADKRHSMYVLKTALELFDGGFREQDFPYLYGQDAGNLRQLLIRCCLMHDVGRGNSMGPVRKSIAVLLNRFFPVWSRRYGRCDSRSYVRGLLYRYYHHGELGGELLRGIGMSTEAAIISLHHKKGRGNMLPENRKLLSILKEADSLN